MNKLLGKLLLTGMIAVGPIAGFSGGQAYAASAAYTVSGNDTMYVIAQRFGVSLQGLIQANPQISNPNIIWPGQKLNVPSSGYRTGTGQAQGQTQGQAPTGSVNGSGSTTTATSAYATQVAQIVNQERAKAGLKPLTVDANLSGMAMDKAKDMYSNHYFDHTSPTYGSPFDMMSQYGIPYSYAGENIAMGQRNPQEVMNAWMNSEGHRANIMNAHFTKIGVAYYNGEWVQEFTG